MTKLAYLMMAVVIGASLGFLLFTILLALIVKWNEVTPDQLYAMLAFF